MQANLRLMDEGPPSRDLIECGDLWSLKVSGAYHPPYHRHSRVTSYPSTLLFPFHHPAPKILSGIKLTSPRICFDRSEEALQVLGKFVSEKERGTPLHPFLALRPLMQVRYCVFYFDLPLNTRCSLNHAANLFNERNACVFYRIVSLLILFMKTERGIFWRTR